MAVHFDCPFPIFLFVFGCHNSELLRCDELALVLDAEST